MELSYQSRCRSKATSAILHELFIFQPTFILRRAGLRDEKTVRKLEKRIEAAVLEVITDMGLKRLLLLPFQQTMHLMAKAAVAGCIRSVRSGSASRDRSVSVSTFSRPTP
jgi:hypothetical protein